MQRAEVPYLDPVDHPDPHALSDLTDITSVLPTLGVENGLGILLICNTASGQRSSRQDVRLTLIVILEAPVTPHADLTTRVGFVLRCVIQVRNVDQLELHIRADRTDIASTLVVRLPCLGCGTDIFCGSVPTPPPGCQIAIRDGGPRVRLLTLHN